MRISDLVKKIILVFGGVIILGAAVMIIVSLFNRKDDDEAFSNGEKTYFVTSTDAPSTEATTEATTEYIVAEPELIEDTTQDMASSTDTVQQPATVTAAVIVEDKDMVDENDPFFLICPSSVSVGKGKAFDVEEHVGYADDYDRDVELEVSGEVDTSTTGSYPVKLTLKDDAGHTKTNNMTVTVVESTSDTTEPSSDGGSETFESFESNYKKEGTTLGIDVSRWQKTIDFEKVKSAGCDFVIIRIGGLDDGKRYEDSCFKENIKNAKAAGLKVGIYWHAEESSMDEVRDSVDYLMNLLGGESLDFPIAYDWEDFYGFQKYGMNLYDINNCFEVFCEEVEKEGYEACLYSSKNFLENTWTNSSNHKVWLANYTSQTTYAGEYYMWQHSSTGKIDGISTAVDFNVLYE